MNGEKKYGFGWLVGPALFVVGVAALLVTWKMLEPSHLVRLFDQDGRSPFELANHLCGERIYATHAHSVQAARNFI